VYNLAPAGVWTSSHTDCNWRDARQYGSAGVPAGLPHPDRSPSTLNTWTCEHAFLLSRGSERLEMVHIRSGYETASHFFLMTTWLWTLRCSLSCLRLENVLLHTWHSLRDSCSAMCLTRNLGRRNIWLHTTHLRPLLSCPCSSMCLEQTSETDWLLLLKGKVKLSLCLSTVTWAHIREWRWR